MDIFWSQEAAIDIAGVIGNLKQEHAPSALHVAKNISDKIAQLKAFPFNGRAGRVVGTREMVSPPIPFVVVYRVRDRGVEIVRVLHNAQRWLPPTK